MQKKLIALAVAGLLSAPAFAQSNVTLYGSIDYGFTSLGNHVGTTKSRSAIDSGISKSNRLGFKGAEDLGDGLKAVFVLETGIQGDNDSLFAGSGGKARQSYAGIAGDFGTVAFGRHYTPQHLFTAAVDPFGKNGLGNAGNVLTQDQRLDNLAAYISPNWSGFSFILGWTFNGIGNEAAGNNGDVRVWAIAPSFTWEKLFVAANYHSAKLIQNPGDDTNVLNAWDLMTSYDFDIVKLGALYGQRKNKLDNTKTKQWMVGATFRVTPNDSILASYNRAKTDAPGSPRIGQWAIGYEHALTKRTALYGQFAMQNWNDAARNAKGLGSFGVGSFPTDAAPGGVGQRNVIAEPYRRGFAVGFRHDF